MKAEYVLPLIETKNATELWEMTKELVNDAQSEVMRTNGVACTEHFSGAGNPENQVSGCGRPEELSNEMHINKRESLQKTTKHLQNFVDREVQQLHQLTLRRKQRGKDSKLWEGA